MKIVMEAYEEIEILPIDSIVMLKVTAADVKEIPSTRNGGSWQKLELTFKIMDIQTVGDGTARDLYEGLITRNIWGSVPFRFNTSPENKLKQWVEAILGMELTEGFELDTDLLVNRSVRGITTTYDKRTIDTRTGKPFTNHQIDALLPMGGGGPMAMSTPAPAASLDGWGSSPAAAAIDWDADPPF